MNIIYVILLALLTVVASRRVRYNRVRRVQTFDNYNTDDISLNPEYAKTGVTFYFDSSFGRRAVNQGKYTDGNAQVVDFNPNYGTLF
ncbi:hypothetical protein KGM_210454 [Danaus plexippus plexippus]|uniref:Uncharacterized protein n=1 Tax=Danaus plexippus plexippus TaxID=278856 RepID=A0A212FCW2_DANPL|nr:hypothetical protein KGM_210454 [Danaus plexippus plexippus]